MLFRRDNITLCTYTPSFSVGRLTVDDLGISTKMTHIKMPTKFEFFTRKNDKAFYTSLTLKLIGFGISLTIRGEK